MHFTVQCVGLPFFLFITIFICIWLFPPLLIHYNAIFCFAIICHLLLLGYFFFLFASSFSLRVSFGRELVNENFTRNHSLYASMPLHSLSVIQILCRLSKCSCSRSRLRSLCINEKCLRFSAIHLLFVSCFMYC